MTSHPSISPWRNRIDLHRFTSITEPETAYLLGFVWADGHVTLKRGPKMTMVLKETDWNDIEPIVKRLGDFSLFRRPPGKRGSSQGGFYTGYRELVDYLVAHDYHIKSTAAPTKILSTIPDHLKHYWWRGYVDGDGCYKVSDIGRYYITIGGSFQQDWSAVEDLLNELKIEFRVKRVERLNPQSNVMNRHSVAIVSNRHGFSTLGAYLHEGHKTDHLGLRRKYDIYKRGLSIMERRRAKLAARSQPIAVFTREWQPIGEYPSIVAAATALHLKDKVIREYFRFNRKWCKQYQFKRLPPPPPPSD